MDGRSVNHADPRITELIERWRGKRARIEPETRALVVQVRIAYQVGARVPSIAECGTRNCDGKRRTGNVSIVSAELPSAEDGFEHGVHLCCPAPTLPKRQLVDPG